MIKEEIRFGLIENVEDFVNIINFDNFMPLATSIGSYIEPNRVWCKAICNGQLAAIFALTPNKFIEGSINIDLIQMNTTLVNKYIDAEILDELKHILAERNLKLTANLTSAINISPKAYEQSEFTVVNDEYLIA